MKRWSAFAVCAVAVAAVGIFAVWAFAVRDSSATVFVNVKGSGNPAEDKWAARMCTAVAGWERPWVETVFRPTDPPDWRKTLSVATVIERMRVLTRQLRADLDRVVPPTKRTRRWQRYVAKDARTWDVKLATLNAPNFHRNADVTTPWSAIYGDVSRTATLASPHLGVLFAEAKACDEVDRYGLTGHPWP